MSVLRSALFLLWMYGGLVVLGLLWLPSLLMPRQVAVAGIRLFARHVRAGLTWIVGAPTEIRGLHNLPEGPVLYTGKHQCMWDVLIPFLVRADPAIIMKRELNWYPVFGWYALKTAMIPIDRAGASRTLRRMVKTAVARRDAGRDVVIFPEGTRHPPGAVVGYFSAGTGALYKSLDVPVVPVATNSGLCWPARGIGRRRGRIVYEILPPISPGLDRRMMMSRLENALEPASARLLEEGLDAQGRTKADLGLAA